MDILHDCLDTGEAVGRGIWTVVIGVFGRCRWVEWGHCLMLGGGRHWVGCAVVLVIAWRGLGAIMRVDKPIIIAFGGLSEGIVVT